MLPFAHRWRPRQPCKLIIYARLNVSSACWVGCFYRTILGADGMLPMPNADYGAMGVSLDDLIAAWDAPFSSDDPAQGGCPGIPVARR